MQRVKLTRDYKGYKDGDTIEVSEKVAEKLTKKGYALYLSSKPKKDSFEDKYNRLEEQELAKYLYNNGVNDDDILKECIEELQLNYSAKVRRNVVRGYFKDINKTEEDLEEFYRKLDDKVNQRKSNYAIKNRAMDNFIFNEDEVYSIENFTFCNINKDTIGYGLLLDKNIDIKDKSGNVVGTDQKKEPVIITSNGEFLRVMGNRIKLHNIKFNNIPLEMDRRWSLESIKAFLHNDVDDIDGQEIYKVIEDTYKSLMYYQSDNWYRIHALWDIGTYFFMLFKAYPIIELRGRRGSAKTKTMQISSSFTFNATGVMVDPSKSTLFRDTHEYRPTKYIDEAENLFKFEKGQLIGDERIEVINSGYSKGGRVAKQELINKRYRTVRFNTYSPTMIGSINGLQGATQDRAIVHITIKAPNNDKRGDLDLNTESPEIQKIRDWLYIFALQNWKTVSDIYNSMENETKLKNRDFQIWKPLLSIAELIDKDLRNDILKFAEKQTEIKITGNIMEDEYEFEIAKSMLRLFDMSNKNEPQKILIKSVIDFLPYDKPPHPKTIAKKIDNFGLKDFKQHFNDGWGYNVTYNTFFGVISVVFPSFASFVSQKEKDNNKDIVDKEEKVTD